MTDYQLNNKISITFIDTEIEPKNQKILDIGAIKDDGSSFHKASITEFTKFLEGTEFICGHNIINHDLKYIAHVVDDAKIELKNVIDTLFLSPLLFPKNPYHSLVKDDKLQSDEFNNPLNDAIKAKDLFYDEVAKFDQLDDTLKKIFYHLLKDQREFCAFFKFVNYKAPHNDIEVLIRQEFKNKICEQADLNRFITTNPIALAYSLSLISSFINEGKVRSITPRWVLKNYPEVERMMFLLRNKPCLNGCGFCNEALDIHKGLKRFFKFDAFRRYGGEPLQEKAVKAAVDHKSLIAVFPTGGGKSITFQLPALMSGENSKGLTVVISPLQSLMKDQVDNLENKEITDAVTINGLLNPIERSKSFERVEDGSATILYLSPESLRSKSIERLILGRKIARFVIDEAHCFSSWGQDFRVDYLYIGDFIKLIQEKKNLEDPIPVSCFTATAKQKVIEDIRDYFKEKLSLDLEVFTSTASRTNLQYQVLERIDEEDKYQTLRDLIEDKNCPTIVYVSRTHKAYTLAERLAKDGFNAKPYHGKIDKQEKTENQDSFINGTTQVMVATSAFGMGVDKSDVKMVIHYEISDSLENYVQEAGRAGRDESIEADCFVLYREEDLSKHFILLNQTKLSIKEIQQVWNAIKYMVRYPSQVSNSALEIARKAGWDDNVLDIESRVKTAIYALEDAGYLRRGQNIPRVFANSILSKNAQEAIDKINTSKRFEGKQKEKAIRIIKKLFSSKSKKHANEETAEARVDYISDALGMQREEVIKIVTALREEGILADSKDLTAFIKKGENKNRSFAIVDEFSKIENFLLSIFEESERIFHLKELNEAAEANGLLEINISKLKTVINFWAIKNWIKRKNLEYSKNHIVIMSLHPKEVLEEKLEKRHELAKFIVEFLYQKSNLNISKADQNREEILVEFSVHELKAAYENGINLRLNITIDDIEDTLFYLSRIEAIKIEGGFLVIYNRLTINRIEQDNKKRYTKDDYQKLHQFYENKIQQIHIVGEYATKMMADYNDALQFVEDYFQLNYPSFLNKYFQGSRQNEIKRNLTPAKFKQLFGELSPTQLKIINDNETKYIVVAAGPGSGKTKVLVHKLASLLLMEDVKHEQLLMLTFSRAAVTEFRKRLLKLIGPLANYIEIKTFHSYCFDLLGKVGSLDKSEVILKKTIERIKNGEVEANRITKTVLVIDEAQDMHEDEFNLVKALMDLNEDMRVIAVGDDDQNIFEFRGASSKYLEQLSRMETTVKHELVENYRSKSNLVDFANQFVKQIPNRLKENPVVAMQPDNGKIKLVRYQSANLIEPLVSDLLNTGLSGTTCILTKTNEEALQVTGLLLKNKMQAKLIQTNDGFSLHCLLEIRFFLNAVKSDNEISIISDEIWDNAKRELIRNFKTSNKLEVSKNIIKDFEAINPKKKYKSDLDTFIRESKLEDFYNENGETIYVSTIHKAKGKEFNNVFLLLENFDPTTVENKRQLYVAITRAKQNLSIHVNSSFLDNIYNGEIEKVEDQAIYQPPNELIMQLTHKEVYLNYFAYIQPTLENLRSGDLLTITEDGCADANGNLVLKFSRKFLEVIATQNSKGYQLKSAIVNYIVYWFPEGKEQELRIVLPEVCFAKMI